MNNLYVFAIGGSGERVMRSLIMLLAAGVKLGANNVIPIFVDNDANSKALKRCMKLIKYYNACSENDHKMGISTLCQQYETEKRGSFFQTKIDNPILLDIAGDTIGNLKKIIGEALNADNKIEKEIIEERDLLFSEDDLNMKLTVGFVGNPNIGSVVLNTLSFANIFTETGRPGPDDGVMVIGSLFGGTGAAGFPLIVNNFTSEDGDRPAIGGVAVLPYFDFGDKDQYNGKEKIIDTEKWDVNSGTFSTKTRAALMYYDDYMNDMDYLYYVGDENRSTYPHYVGGEKQDNPVHIVELLSAMSVIDFSMRRREEHIVYKNPVFGISEGQGNNPTVCNVSSIKNKEIKRALIKFQLMREFFINSTDGFLAHCIENKNAIAKDLGFTETMRQSCIGKEPNKIYKNTNEMDNVIKTETNNFPYSWGLNAFFKEWISWLSDLNGKEVKRPFDIFHNGDNDITINNITQKFFSEDDFGVAASETKMEGYFPRRRVTIAKFCDMTTHILNAHNKLKWRNVPEERKLAALLKTISDGIDTVIDKTCLI